MFEYSEALVLKYINGIYDGSITEYDLPEGLYGAIGQYFQKGLYKGFGMTLADAKGKDLELLTELRENIWMFSAAKTFQETKDIRSLLFNEGGELRTNKEFNEVGMKAYDTWNNVWGATEYNTTVGQAQSASKWNEIEANKKLFPMLIYSAIDDANTSEECIAMAGITAPVDDPIWDMNAPLQHFNCFIPETKILTKNGFIKIKEVKIGDLIIGGSGKEQEVYFINVKNFSGQMCSIHIKNNSVTATKEHRFLTITGWRMAENIVDSDILIQNINIGTINKIICTINNFYVIIAYFFMSIKRKWESGMMNTFNTNIVEGNKNINKAIIDKFIYNTRDIFTYKKIKHFFFASGRFFMILPVKFRVGIHRFNCFFTSTFSCFSIKHRVFSFHQNCGIGSFNSNSPMRVFFSHCSHIIRCFYFSIFCVKPLSFDSFPSFSRFKSIFSKKTHKCSSINIPFNTNFSKSKHINKVPIVEGFTSGQPLDSFNSLFNFLTYSFFHRKFVLVKTVKNIDYTGQIYNLSVNIDETYITNVGVVHNCRCVLLQQEEGVALTSEEDKQDAADKAYEVKNPMFNMNPGKDGYVFKDDHPYFAVERKDKDFAKNNFDLPLPERPVEREAAQTGLNIEQAIEAMKTLFVSDVEKTALIDYTGGEYNGINGYLRGVRKTITSENESNIKTLDSFLESAPKLTETSYRGLTLDEENFNVFKDLKKGSVFTDNAFMSTTYDKAVAENFSGSANYQVSMVIEGKNGVLIQNLSDAKKEKEILFGRGSKYKVTAIKSSGKKGLYGKILVNLKEI